MEILFALVHKDEPTKVILAFAQHKDAKKYWVEGQFIRVIVRRPEYETRFLDKRIETIRNGHTIVHYGFEGGGEYAEF